MNDIMKSGKWAFLERPSVPGMDKMMGVPQPVLDHGFVRLVDYMGDEAAIPQAARVSYGKGTKSVSEDRGLIRYLMRHRHTTPFEMCEIKLHVKLPIFVARQWIRHRTANVNEYSARYSILAKEFYVPNIDDIQPQSKTNKQGRDGSLPEQTRRAMAESIRMHSYNSYEIYEELHTGWPWFDEEGNEFVIPGGMGEPIPGREPHMGEHGMAREMARMVVPTNVYTEWYWKVDLHNLLHFLSLRADPHAQMEIRVYADAICNMVKTWVPHTWEAFEDYVMGGEHFSRQEMELIREMVQYSDSALPEGMSSREWNEFNRKIGTLT